MFLILIFIPLFNFLIISFFGRFIGKNGAFFLVTINMTIVGVFGIGYFILGFGPMRAIEIGTWIVTETIIIPWSFYFDSLTAAMYFVINVISYLVHVYSLEYMSKDAHRLRFISYLSLFTFFMLLLITGSNLIILFLGWEGVGLSSYLLISFWYTRINANKAAIKALIVNRISDFALTIGILLVIFVFQTTQFSIIYVLIPFFKEKNIIFLNFIANPLLIIGFLLFIGAMGKSAQLMLHTWLPDAMEGPTPVSALIHAATMVTAGVFLVIKCSILFETVPVLLTIITLIGATTAFFSATVGLVQNDIKKVIAYSTCSQLGYMFFVCGLSGYNIALFHLINHAFFKALLFLSAGAIIHSVSSEQDMRKYGGLLNLMPLTYTMLFIGSLALMGFPFTTGYYSKDFIIEFTFARYTLSSSFACWLGLITAFLTAFYSFRLLYLTFFDTINMYKQSVIKVHETKKEMSFVLGCLSIGSIFLGYFIKDQVIGFGIIDYASNIIILNINNQIIETEFVPFWIKILPFIFSISAVCFGFLFYLVLFKHFNYLKLLKYIKKIYIFLINKWFFDLIYNRYINLSILTAAYNSFFSIIDKGILELIGPYGFKILINRISLYSILTQRGLLIFYGRFIYYFMYFFLLIFAII